jgi:hypothetical protein
MIVSHHLTKRFGTTLAVEGFFSATVGFLLMTAYIVAAIWLGAALLGRRDA